MRNFYTAYHTDIGIKKKVNQDSLLLMEISNGNDDILLAVLCDGMGGMAKGELASATVIRAFSDWFMNVYPQKGTLWTVEDIKQQWHSLLKRSNEKLIAYGNENHIELGTTATAVLLSKDGRYLIGHIGDTRVYRLKGSTDAPEQLTEDHTFVAREIRRGNMTLEQAQKDSRRNVLLQCIGVNRQFEIQFLTGNVSEEDALLLCSDGFRHVVSGTEIQEHLQSGNLKDENIIKEKLTDLVGLNMSRGETDNISAIYIKKK